MPPKTPCDKCDWEGLGFVMGARPQIVVMECRRCGAIQRPHHPGGPAVSKPTTIRELFSVRERWTRFHPAVRSDGTSCAPTSQSACRWCLGGAVWYVYPDTAGDVFQKLRAAIYYTYGRCLAISAVNDHYGYSAVLALVERAGV